MVKQIVARKVMALPAALLAAFIVIAYLAANSALAPMAQANGVGVGVELFPATQTVNVGQQFDISIQVLASADNPADTAQVYLNFSPAHLQVESVTPGELDSTLQNNFDNTLGNLNFAAGNLTSDPMTAMFTLATARFTALTPASSTDFVYNLASPRHTKVFHLGDDTTGSLTPASVAIEQPLVSIELLPASQTVQVGDQFDVVVQVNPSEAAPVDTAQVYLNVDHSKLRTESVTPGGVLDTTLQHSFDNGLGQVNFAAGNLTSSAETVPFALATVRFTALAPASPTDVVYNLAAPRHTKAFLSGDDVTGSLSPASVFIEQPRVDIELLPASQTVQVGDEFDVAVRVNASAVTPTDTVQAYLNFDPSKLEAVSLTPGTALPQVLQNSFDNGLGHVSFAAGSNFGDPGADSPFDLVTARFQALALASPTDIIYNLAAPRHTKAFLAGDDVTGSLAPANVFINEVDEPEPPAITEFTVTPSLAEEGQLVTATVTFTDPDGGPHSVVFDWGDGSTSEVNPASSPASATHVYTDNGDREVAATVTDNIGLIDTELVTLTLMNIAPVVSAGDDATISLGEIFQLEAVFSDAGSADTHMAHVDWGDGTTDDINPAVSPISLDHTYGSSGSFAVTISVTDDDGGVGSAPLAVTVLTGASFTHYSPDMAALGSIGATATITVTAGGVPGEVNGVQINTQHPDTLAIRDVQCVGIFDGATALPIADVEGGSLLGCAFLAPGSTVSGPDGAVMTFTFERVGDFSTDQVVTFGLGGEFGAKYDASGVPIGPGDTNTLTVKAGVTVSGKTTLQFRSSTVGLVNVTITDGAGFTASIVAANDGSWQFQGVPPGTYNLSASAFSYLSANMAGLVVGSSDVALAANTLLAGDINGSGAVNISDVNGTIANFGKGVQGWSGTPSHAAGTGSIMGKTTLQFRSNTQGKLTVTVSRADGFSTSVAADSAGNWRIDGLTPGTYTVTATAPSYLRAQFTGLELAADEEATMTNNSLLAGDINGSNAVNISDVNGTIANFGKGGQVWPLP